MTDEAEQAFEKWWNFYDEKRRMFPNRSYSKEGHCNAFLAGRASRDKEVVEAFEEGRSFEAEARGKPL